MNVLEKIKQQIADNKIIIYMKGSPSMPQCGFSAQAVACLHACNAQFHHVDILMEPEIRKTLPEYANWPTFPQLYVNGELIGGCDIITQMHKNGTLEPLLKNA